MTSRTCHMHDPRLRMVRFLIVCTLWLMPGVLVAQTPSGRVSVSVKGPDGSLLAGARVTLTPEPAGTPLRGIAGAEGRVEFSAVPAGSYRLDATYDGMEFVSRGGVVVRASQATVLDIVMTVGTQRERVDVVGQAGSYEVGDGSSAMKTPMSILLVPQSVQLVPRAVMRDQVTLTLTEAVRNVAGVSSDFGFNGGTQPLLTLRGFQMTSMTAYGSMSGSSSYYLNGTKIQGVPINMANVQSVEVVKGPAAVLYGRSEPGGLVNVVSRPMSSVPQFGFEQTVAQYGATRTLAEAAGPLNASRTLLGRAAGSFLNNKSNRDFVRDRLGAFSGSLTWAPGPGTRLTGSFDRTTQRYRNDFGIPAIGARPADLPWNRQFNDAPDLSRIASTTLSVDLTQRLTQKWSLTARGMWLRSDTREVDVWPYRVDLTTGADCFEAYGLLCRYYYYVRPDGQARTHQASVEARGDLTTGRVRHRLLLGVESFGARKSGTTFLAAVDPVDIFSPMVGSTPRLDRSLSVPSEFVDDNRWTSGYVQDVAEVGGGVHVMGGIRFDRTDAIFAEPGTLSVEKSFVTPRIGVVWQASAGQSAYGQYQDAVNANNGRDPVSGDELDAERSRQVEVGYKVRSAGGGLHATLAAYQLTKRNRVDYSLFPKVQTVGEARSRGLEVDVLGRVTSRLAVMAAYAYTSALITFDPLYQDKRLANVPTHGGSVWLRYMLSERWAAGGGVFAQGLRQGDVQNTFQLPAYGRTDAMLSYTFRARGWQQALQLNVNNLFNQRYYSGSHQWVRDWIQVGAQRTVVATLRLER